MKQRDHGASAVEFALILPILVLLILGITEFGRAYHVQTMLSQAAREGVRALALADEADATATTRSVVKSAAPDFGLTDATIGVAPTSCVGKPSPTSATVTVKTTVELAFFGDITLTGKGTMRCNG